MIRNRILNILILISAFALLLTGCGEEEGVQIESQTTTTRSNETVVLVPEVSMEKTIGTSDFVVDYTNASEGYIGVEYTGENPEVRLQVVSSESVTYTHNIPSGEVIIPISEGSGRYTLIGYESVAPGEYAIVFSEDLELNVKDETLIYLYPNMYVDFTKDTKAVSLAKTLAADCTCDIEVINAVYKYVTDNITYDHELAENVQSGYLPDVDNVLETGKGICFDYASLMASMLRSQRIPTRLEIGYAGTAYHAWVSSYIEDVGWINGVIQFDGTDWTLMDPTFAANTSAQDLKNFIGEGDNYVTKYVY